MQQSQLKLKVTYHKIVPMPSKPANLPVDIKWLSGEGCGSWFHIEKDGNDYIIARYSPQGKKECAGSFSIQSLINFDLKKDFEMTYLSHCAEVNVIQNGKKYKFILIEKYDV